MTKSSLSGGCQCGAVRFRVAKLGRPSICHCRMCQKAFGGFFAALVTAEEYQWSRGEPSWFKSSNLVERGFCDKCGTPLAYRHAGGLELAIGAFDQPELIPPVLQIHMRQRIEYVDNIAELPAFDTGSSDEANSFFAGIKNLQHPDFDTEFWPPKER